MLNKFLKTTHNNYSRLFKFIFFLRYLIATFFISSSLFLTIPIFLNHEKKVELIKIYLIENYDFEINEYENIKYKAFPLPSFEFEKTQIKFLKPNIARSGKPILPLMKRQKLVCRQLVLLQMDKFV